jgi:hypothetical protein
MISYFTRIFGKAFIKPVYLFVLITTASQVCATDINPRAFSNAPIGTNFLLASYNHSRGGVSFDDALPVEDVDATIHSLLLGYGRVFNFFGQSAKAGIILPVIDGHLEGLLAGEPATVDRQGLADVIVLLSTNFYGAPSLSARQFGTYQQNTIIGASLQFRLPTGEYDNDKIINLGSNRFSVRPRLGISHHRKSWTYEFALGATFYGDNDDFVGTRVERSPIYDAQLHAIYSIKPGMWMSFDVIKLHGGQTEVEGVARNDLQKTDRLGITFSLPLTRQHSLKFIAQTGVGTRIGADLDTLGITYQFVW